MARPSYQNINSNPCLNELVYSVLRSAEKEELLRLHGRFLRASKSDKKAKAFCANAKYDEKITLLAEFGIRFFTIFANHENINSSKIKAILQKFEGEQKGMALDAISEAQIYVESDKEYIHLLGLMANTSNHPSYKLNLEFQRAGYHSKKWTTSAKNIYDRHVVETIQHADYLVKAFLSSLIAGERAETLFRITTNQIKLLLYLYTMRHTHISVERGHNYFLGNLTSNAVRKNLKKLEELQYIELHPTAEPIQFIITSLGIGIVNRFLQTTFNQIQ